MLVGANAFAKGHSGLEPNIYIGLVTGGAFQHTVDPRVEVRQDRYPTGKSKRRS